MRILFILNLLIICLCTLSAQSDVNPTNVPFPTKKAVVTSKAGTEMKTTTQPSPSVKTAVSTKPAPVAGKGVTAKTNPSVKTTTKAETVTKTTSKTKKHVKSKTVTTKSKSKTANKTTVKAKTPATVTTTKTKTVPTQYAVVAVKKADPTTAKGTALTSQTSVPMSFSKEMLMAVNALRKSGTTCGGEKMPPVKPLGWNAQLESAAVVHVADMDVNDHFSHAGTNGTLPDDRIKAAGYEWSRVGENIGQGYKDVTAAMKGWKASTNHCKQMMSADVIDIGAAKKGKYWCVTFAAPLE